VPVPLATTVNVAFDPISTLLLCGCVLIVGIAAKPVRAANVIEANKQATRIAREVRWNTFIGFPLQQTKTAFVTGRLIEWPQFANETQKWQPGKP
jgi:hypothetical protein